MRKMEKDTQQERGPTESERRVQELRSDVGQYGHTSGEAGAGKKPSDISRALHDDLKPEMNDWRKMNPQERGEWLQTVSDTLNRKLRLPQADLQNEASTETQRDSGNGHIVSDELLNNDSPDICLHQLCKDAYCRYQREQIYAWNLGSMVDDPSKAEAWSRELQRNAETVDSDRNTEQTDEGIGVLDQDARDFASETLREIIPPEKVAYSEIAERFQNIRKWDNFSMWMEEKVCTDPWYAQHVPEVAEELRRNRGLGMSTESIRENINKNICGQIAEDMTEEALQPFFKDVVSQRRISTEDGHDTKVDKVFIDAKTKIDFDRNFRVIPGEDLFVEVKCGKKEYLSQQFQKHIPHQLLGHEGNSMVITSSNFKDLPAERQRTYRKQTKEQDSHIYAYLGKKQSLDAEVFRYIYEKSLE